MPYLIKRLSLDFPIWCTKIALINGDTENNESILMVVEFKQNTTEVSENIMCSSWRPDTSNSTCFKLLVQGTYWQMHLSDANCKWKIVFVFVLFLYLTVSYILHAKYVWKL